MARLTAEAYAELSAIDRDVTLNLQQKAEALTAALRKHGSRSVVSVVSGKVPHLRVTREKSGSGSGSASDSAG